MKDPVRPRVSIVMPTYGRAQFIPHSIQSLLDQSFDDFELLVRDDCSPDDTEKAVAAFKDSRINYHRNDARLGMPGNLNSGIKESVGEFVLVCHDHDLYQRPFVEKMVEALETHPSALFVHSGIAFIDSSGRQIGRECIENVAPLVPGDRWLNYMLSKFDCPVCANAMVRRSAYEEFGLYGSEFGFISDVEMWMRLSRQGDVAYVAAPLIYVREREKDHQYARINWQLIDTLLRIHRLYRSKKQIRSLLRTDWYLLRQYLTVIYQRDRDGHSAGRHYLQSSGMFLSRIAAYLI